MRLNTAPPANLPKQKHTIVILGYALAEDGTMKEPLLERLNAGLSIAKKYPNSKKIVTGGVSQDRILKENQSTDTVENALFTTEILEKQGQ